MNRKAGRGRRPRPGPRPAGPRPGRRARAPARPAAAGPAPVPVTGRAPLGASFVYALLSKNAVNRGFLRFSKSMKCCQVLAKKRL